MSYCDWDKASPLNIQYHNKEWGVPLHDDKGQFEFLMMEVMQCGLNWNMMINKREIFRKAFDGFDYDKIAAYDTNFDFNVSSSLIGGVSFHTYFDLINNLIDGKQKEIIELIESLSRCGTDFRWFVNGFLEFCLDLYGYTILKEVRTIPKKYENLVISSTNIQEADNYYDYVVKRLNSLKNDLKNDSNSKTAVMVALLQICRLI